jgi:phosphopantothenoylcysteine synthetase/decarboxylase
MKTIEEIKADILASNPSRTYVFNDETFEQTEEEFQEAVQKRAVMEYEQQVFLAEQKAKKQAKVSGYQKLGLSDVEIIAIVGLTQEELESLLA